MKKTFVVAAAVLLLVASTLLAQVRDEKAFEVWRVKATILQLAEPEGTTTSAPSYTVITEDEPALSEADAKAKAATWAQQGLLVPSVDAGGHQVGTFYPPHTACSTSRSTSRTEAGR